MVKQILLFAGLFFTMQAFAQMENVPFKDGQVIYERVIYLDSINNKDLVFNSAKSALIRNTNYKYTKVDEDRTSGSITTEIAFKFVVQTVLGAWTYDAKSNLSIDVKENRFRIRIYNNNASFVLMNQLVNVDLTSSYIYQQEQIAKNNYRPKKDNVTPWNNKLLVILDAFSNLVKEGVKDDF